jgi:hypothetical protein
MKIAVPRNTIKKIRKPGMSNIEAIFMRVLEVVVIFLQRNVIVFFYLST